MVLPSGMGPLTLYLPEHSRAVLQQEINRHQDARYDHRLHCVLLVSTGMSCEKVAGFFGDSPRTLVNWVRRFERQGLAGLAEGNHSGRPARLSAEQLEEVRALVRQPPSAAGLDAGLWDGKSLSACLAQRYGVPMGVRQCQRLFRLVDTRYRLRRPLVAKADPRRQAEHKKNSRRGRKT
jgi:transposase